MFEVFAAREVLLSGYLGPALHDVFITLVEGMLEVQQRHNQSGRQTGTARSSHPGSGNGNGWTKQIDICNALTGTNLTDKPMRE